MSTEYRLTGWVTCKHKDNIAGVEVTKIPERPTPTAHLQVLRNPRHPKQHSNQALSPSLCNISDSYIRHIERQYDNGTRLLYDKQSSWKAQKKNIDEIVDVLRWHEHLAENASGFVAASYKSEQRARAKEPEATEMGITKGNGKRVKKNHLPQEWAVANARVENAVEEFYDEWRTVSGGMNDEGMRISKMNVERWGPKEAKRLEQEKERGESEMQRSSKAQSRNLRGTNASDSEDDSRTFSTVTDPLALERTKTLYKAANIQTLSDPFEEADDEDDVDDMDHLYSHDDPPNLTIFDAIVVDKQTGDITTASDLPLTPFSVLQINDSESDDDSGNSDGEDLDHIYSHDRQPSPATPKHGANSKGEVEFTNPDANQIGISTAFEDGNPSNPQPHRQIDTMCQFDDDKFFRPTIVDGPYSGMATTAAEERILYAIISQEEYASKALRLLCSGLPLEPYNNHPSRCSWKIKPLANNAKLLQQAAASSPIPVIRLTSVNGALCELIEAVPELPWDIENHIAEREGMQEVMEERIKEWRGKYESFSEYGRRLKAQIWWAERMIEEIKRAKEEVEERRRDAMRVCAAPSLEDIEECVGEGEGDGMGSGSWEVESTRWARRMVMRGLKGTTEATEMVKTRYERKNSATMAMHNDSSVSLGIRVPSLLFSYL